MKFSLVMCTVNRDVEVKRFFESITLQSYKNFEVILVDQNKDDRLKSIIEKYEHIVDLVYIKSEQIGLSKNRNIGLKYITGDIIAFPDDDCVYPKHTLERVYEIFRNNKNTDSITIKFTELNECSQNQLELNDFRSSMVNKVRKINKYTWVRRICSITIFVNRTVYENIGGFNEKLGLGDTIIPAGEDHDYALNIMNNGYSILDVPEIAVLHPVPKIDLLNISEYNKNKNRIELTGKVNMYFANHYKLGLDFKLFRIFDRILGLVYNAIRFNGKRCKLIISDIKSMCKYWNIYI